MPQQGNSDFNLILFGSFPITFRAGSLNIQEKVNQRATLDFQREEDGSDTWNIGMSIDAYEFGVHRFGGLVNEADFQIHEATDGKKIWSIKCVDFGLLADRRAMVRVLANGSVESKRTWTNAVISDIVTQIGQDYLIDDGVDFTTYVFADVSLIASSFATDCSSVTQALNQLAQLASSLSGQPYTWYMDFGKALHFQPWTQNVSAITLNEANTNCRTGTIHMSRTGEQFTTRVIDKVAALISAPIAESFDGSSISQALDGTLLTWQLQKPVAIAPTITLDATLQTVGVQGVDTGMQFYWQPGSTTITAATAPAATSTLDIVYSAEDAEVIVVEDAGAIAARQAVEGMSGIYDLVVDSGTTPQTQQDAQQKCQAELDRRSAESVKITLQTPESGIFIGDQILFDIPSYDTDLYLVRSLRTFDEAGALIWRELELVKGPIVMDSVEYFRALLGTAAGVGNAVSVAGSSGNLEIFQRTLLVKDSSPGNDISDHITIYADPGARVRITRVTMLPRRLLVQDLIVRLVFGGPSGSGVIGLFTLPAGTAVNTPIVYIPPSPEFQNTNLVDEAAIWADITQSDGSKDKNGIASVTVEWVEGSSTSRGEGAGAGGGTTEGGGGGTTSPASNPIVDSPSGAVTWQDAPAGAIGASASFGIVEVPGMAFGA